MLEALSGEFERRFGRLPEVAARAPGRVNLIGEHTDYNEGLVLPCAIDRDTWVLAAAASGDEARVFSRERGAQASFPVRVAHPRGDWLDYVQGIVFALREGGMPVEAFDLAVASEVPEGAGLSSSAALELAVVTALDACFGLLLPARDRARLAHRAEQGFVGVACGIMDQFASALAERDHALRLDCRSGAALQVPLPRERFGLLVADSGVRRQLVAGAYGDRVAECRAAFGAAREAGLAPAGARCLRDLALADLPALGRALEPRLLRRARHVITENARVEATCDALRQGSPEAAGECLRAGMRSLQEDFEVSRPELDALCELADALPGVHGSRLTGAGFGGCTLHLVDPAAADEVSRALGRAFERRVGRRPPVWPVAPAAGAELLPC